MSKRGEQQTGNRTVTEAPCEVWGVLNVTPDSFSDGGRFLDPGVAVARAERMLEEGADVLDIGGASSRPAGVAYGAGASAVSPEDETARVLPVIQAIKQRLPATRLSIDTTQAAVARRAVAAGVEVVNDVSCATVPELLQVVAETGADYVLMHNRGTGQVINENVQYGDVVKDVCQELQVALGRVLAAGVAPERVWLDPGLGFAKTAAQSLEVLAATERLSDMGYPVLVGPSRKGFLAVYGTPEGRELPPPAARLGGTISATTAAALWGARAVRVHDVQPTVQAVRLAAALRRVRRGGP